MNQGRRMTLKISFEQNTFKSLNEVLSFILKVIHFEPATVMNDEGKYDLFNLDEILSGEIVLPKMTLNIADDFYYDLDEKQSVFFRQADRFTCSQVFIFKSLSLSEAQKNKIIQESTIKGFFLAYYYDGHNTLNQSEEFPGNLEHQNIPTAHLPRIWDPVLSPIINSKVIDIFQNPGHEKFTFGTWLYAAPQLWFGEKSWKYFDKENLKKYPSALKVEEQGSVLYINLFDPETKNYEAPDIFKIQKDFRIFSKMDEVEIELDAIVRENSKYGAGVLLSTLVVEDPSNTEAESNPKNLVLDIYNTLTNQYPQYEFEKLHDAMIGHFQIIFKKYEADRELRFQIEIPTAPFKIFRREIQITNNDGSREDIREYEHYDDMLDAARKIAKNKKI